MKLIHFLIPFLSLATTAQSVNVDIGPAGSPIPPATFAGPSGKPGVWNLYVPNTGGVANLLDVNGNSSGILLVETQIGPVSNGDMLFNSGVTLDSGHLLLDAVRLAQGSSSPVLTRWTFSGIPAGTYRVTMYGYGPSIHLYYTQFEVFDGAGAALSDVLNTEPEAWSGTFVEGSTHVVANIHLAQSTNSIRIDAQCWSSFSDWGAVNGFQLERYPGCGDPAEVYCTAGTSSHGCVASISASGSASASASSGFPITVTGVEGQRSGMIFYGVSGGAQSPWHANNTSLVCVQPARQRTPIQNSGGTVSVCDGTLALDWNAFRASHPSALGQPFAGGESVFAQAWYRDGGAPGQANLSNAVVFGVCP